jgi:hypothetical protein
MTATDTISSEDAVRLYLTFLEDPAKLIDTGTVKRLQAALSKAKDPVDKLPRHQRTGSREEP